MLEKNQPKNHQRKHMQRKYMKSLAVLVRCGWKKWTNKILPNGGDFNGDFHPMVSVKKNLQQKNPKNLMAL